MSWYVYIIECNDGKLYTGITTDLKRRLGEHNSGKGCKFSRSRAPVKLVYSHSTSSRSKALKKEAWIKSLSRKEKLLLIG